jgi:pimeloyl-ACP methyl ester carboxylesterase
MLTTTLVLLPGLLNNRRVFEPLIEELGDAAGSVVVPELTDYDSVGAMAGAALDAAPERFALGGFSMGGYVALEIMRCAPQRIERLALIDTQAGPDGPQSTARRRAVIEQSTLGRFHGVQPSLLPSLVHPSRLEDPAVVQPILEMGEEIGAEAFIRQQRAIMARRDSRHMLVDIAVPTVVAHGRQDQAIPLSRAQEMAADIAGAHLVVLEKCGHMAPLERPIEVADALRKWLDR